MNKRLSVVISAFNEEKKIEECLKSVSFADEIILIDNSSADNTIKIAKKYTPKIFVRANNPMLNINKNYGFSKAIGDWIFSLDADEKITLELKAEIKSAIEQSNNRAIVGYWIPRKNLIFGKWIEHTGWYPDYQLRLFKNGKGKFPGKHVHEMVKVDGEVGYLENALIHISYESMNQFIQKAINIYIPNEAENILKNGYRFDWRDSIKMPMKEFVSRFFAREGYRDGFHGLMLSGLMSFYHFMIFSYIWEKEKFKQAGSPKFLIETEKEFSQSFKEIFFWFSREKTKLIKNPILKMFYKILEKVSQ